MRVLLAVILLCLSGLGAAGGAGTAAAGAAAPAVPESFFPYPIHKKTLANGLDVLVVEMPEFKDVLSYNTAVLAGSRNETEKGQSGLAHLFEHILFRHRWDGRVGGYEEAIRVLGAHNNAFTNFDITFYHPVTFTRNLARLSELEASRFASLDFDRKIFETETGAVLGEFRRIASDPRYKMEERLLALMFPSHTYGHTTIGFYQDVLDMPRHYEAAVKFYRACYRPNNAVLIVTGDVKKDEIFALAEKRYGSWPRAETPAIPPEAPPAGPRREHVSWEAQAAPRVFVAVRVPAFQTASPETAVGQILPELLVSKSAPLFRRLRYEKQSAAELDFYDGNSGYESFDPRALVLQAQLFSERLKERGTPYFDEVIADITAGLEDLKQFASQPASAGLLEVVKSKYRYDFLSQLNSPANVAQNLAWYYRFERDPQVFDHLVATVGRLTPADVEAFARKYFAEGNRVIVTLSGK